MSEKTDLSKKKQFSDEAKAVLASLNLSDYVVDVEENTKLDDALNDKMKKIVGMCVGIPLFGVFGLSIIFGVSGGVVVSLVVSLLACLIIFDCLFRGSFFGTYDSFKEPLQEQHTEALSDRIQLLEQKTGGIFKAAGYIKIDRTRNKLAAQIVKTLKESQNGSKISDLDCYCTLLCAIQEKIANEVVIKEHEELEKSLKEFTQ